MLTQNRLTMKYHVVSDGEKISNFRFRNQNASIFSFTLDESVFEFRVAAAFPPVEEISCLLTDFSVAFFEVGFEAKRKEFF